MAKPKKAKLKKAKVSKKVRKGRNKKKGTTKKVTAVGPKILAVLKVACARCAGKLGSETGALWDERPQTVALYARKDGQWLAVDGMKLCRNCWKALVKRAQGGFCYSCSKNVPDGQAHRDKTKHSVTRGPRNW